MTETREPAYIIESDIFHTVKTQSGRAIETFGYLNAAEKLCRELNAAFQLGVEHAERTAPKWMERPSGPGLWILQCRFGNPELWDVTEKNIADWEYFASVNFVTRVYGPIPKGTP